MVLALVIIQMVPETDLANDICSIDSSLNECRCRSNYRLQKMNSSTDQLTNALAINKKKQICHIKCK